MLVRNIHTREYAADTETIWAQLQKLSAKDDPIWPFETWPRMVMRPGLAKGASGGHGPIRYTIEKITDGKEIKFRFTAPKGFNGFHLFRLEGDGNTCTLIHEIIMKTSGSAAFTWPLAIRYLHDALIEDAFTKLERTLNLPQKAIKWSLWVRLLRYYFR